MPIRTKKRFDIEITEEDSVHSKTFELDKTTVAVHGILFTSNRDDLLYYRGAAKVEINRQEIFPEDYETKLLMTGINVSPNDRFYDLGGVAPGNFKVKVDYKDNHEDRIGFSPYRVSIYIDLETTDEQ